MRQQVLTSAIVFLIAVAVPGARAGTLPSRTEDFSTRAAADTALTTASWDTVGGVLTLAPFTPRILGSAPVNEHALGVTVVGNIAYVSANQAGLWLYDITDPAMPVKIKHVITTEQILETRIAGDYIYLANNYAGLFILDIRDPRDPVFVSNLVTVGQTTGLDLAGDLVYLSDGPYGVTVIDVRDPANPVQIGNYNTPGYALAVAVSGDYAYIADWIEGLLVLDVSNPAAPVRAGGADTPGIARGIALGGNIVFIADGTPGVLVFDVSDPATPVLRATIDTPGLARGVSLDGNNLYISDFDAGIQVYDVSNPSIPRHLSSLATGGFSAFVAVSGGLAVSTEGSAGILTLQVAATLTPPELRNRVALAGGATGGAAFSGDRLYVADGASGLAALSLSDPALPRLVYHHRDAAQNGDARDVALMGSLAFVASSGSPTLEVVDVSGSVPVRLHASSPAPSLSHVHADGNLLYVLGPGGELTVLDIFDPAVPLARGGIATGSVAADLLVDGDYVYIVDGAARAFFVVSAADTSNPVVVGSYTGSGAVARGIAREGDIVYLCCADGTVDVVSVEAVDTPAWLRTFAVPGSAWAARVAGDQLLVAGGSGGLSVFDIADETSPVFVDALPVADARGVMLRGDYAYVSDSGAGIVVAQPLERRVDAQRNLARSLNINSGGEIVVQARVSTVGSGSVSWRVSASGGVQWSSPDANGWATPDTGSDLRWETTLQYSPAALPAVNRLTLDWLLEHPVLSAVSDVPGDQGGEVEVAWLRSGYDAPGSAQSIVRYVVSRRNGSAWDSVATVSPAPSTDEYRVVVPTLTNVTATDTAYVVFRVAAVGSGATYESPVDSGYSVDNIAPAAPPGAMVARESSGNRLTWDSPADPDVALYRVYRDAGAVPTPDPALLRQSTPSLSWTDPVADGASYYYIVTAVDGGGNESEPVLARTVIDGPTLPVQFALRPAAPNPFRPETTIGFDVPRAADIEISVYDVSGRRIRRLVRRRASAGAGSVLWDGRSDSGARVASGIYFVRMIAPDVVRTIKVALVE